MASRAPSFSRQSRRPRFDAEPRSRAVVGKPRRLQFDTFLIGRKTFEAMMRMGTAAGSTPGIQNIVFSRTLRPSDYPRVTVSSDAERVVTELRPKPGKDIALSDHGELFR